eukprot:4734438-Pyramimonas_sp.AAC.1
MANRHQAILLLFFNIPTVDGHARFNVVDPAVATRVPPAAETTTQQRDCANALPQVAGEGGRVLEACKRPAEYSRP